ncbi:MAG: hypothetical protein KA780_11960, partial [Prolixibacteraceae bacterium]|nr:hypothetical protein [Prolixibacteraceae bacterium]
LAGIPSGSGLQFDYQDFRDDRVYTYFSVGSGESKTFRFALNATYEGRFLMPALVCEGMYDHQVFARHPGQWITVSGQ